MKRAGILLWKDLADDTACHFLNSYDHQIIARTTNAVVYQDQGQKNAVT